MTQVMYDVTADYAGIDTTLIIIICPYVHTRKESLNKDITHALPSFSIAPPHDVESCSHDCYASQHHHQS